MKYFLISFILLFTQVPEKTRRVVYEKNAQHTFHILLDDPKISVDEDVNYYQYVNQQIKISQGSYTALLLHGKYIKADREFNTLAKGGFHKGRKDGEWFYFKPSGELIKIEHYYKGILSGSYKEFKDGELAVKGKYKNDKKVGTWIDRNKRDTINYRPAKSVWNLWGLFGKKKDSIANYPDGTLKTNNIVAKKDTVQIEKKQNIRKPKSNNNQYEIKIINGRKRRVRKW